MSVKVIGMDLALNHAGFVQLVDGELDNFWYVTDRAASAAISKEHGIRLKLLKSKDKQMRSIHRLAFLEKVLDQRILVPNQPDLVGIEDYAIRVEQGAHYLGEIGGIARILCWFRGVKFRLHDPMSVKMFAAHMGNCAKDEVRRCVMERWNADFSGYDAGTTNGQPDRRTSEDLCDAFAVAKLVWTEHQLRVGEIEMSDLHEKEIRVFNRVTKTYPTNLLSREWIQNPDGTTTPHGEPVCPHCGARDCCLAKTGGKVKAKEL